MPSEILAIFERFKSYKGANDALWATNEIANSAKHFKLRLFAIADPSVFYTATITDGTSRMEITSPGGTGIGWDPKKREITLAKSRSGAKTDINANITFKVAIDGIDVTCCQCAPSFLDAAAYEVESVLMATEAECRRLEFIT